MPAHRSSEAHFQQQVEQLATYYGWRIYHTHDSRRSHPGFPDLVLVRPPELIFAELKTDKGRLTPAQREWIGDLTAVADAVAEYAPRDLGVQIDTFVWRPADFDDLNARLARGRRRTQPLYREAA